MLTLRETQLLTLAIVAKIDYYRCNPEAWRRNDYGRARRWIIENISEDFKDGELAEALERIQKVCREERLP